jgi:RHS repeat-associated protein
MQAPDGPVPLPLLDTRTYTTDGALRTHQVSSDSTTLLRAASYTVDAEGRVLSGADSANKGHDLLNPATMAFTYTGLGQLIATNYQAQSDTPYTQYAAAESTTYDPLGNWTTRTNVDQWLLSHSNTFAEGFTTLGTKWAHYDAVSGRLKGDSLSTGATDTLRYDAAGNLHATLTGRTGNPIQYTERVSYYALDGRLVAADARSGGGTYMLGHTAFEEYRYDALGRRVWVRARRWCSDQSGAGNQGDEVACDLSTVRRTVWSGSQELAEIQMPAADLTPSDTVENDTLAVHRRRSAAIPDAYYDSNRFFGVALDVLGPGLDQPVAVTRVNYADASDLHTGAVTWQAYAPFSLVGLWNNQGRVDRVVYGGTAAPGATALCVDPGTQYRCVYPGIDWGEFPYLRPGQAAYTWQGTVLVDKPDATGTYYRRNRSYDPNTARFTQEDPLGLGGGLNVYGFNGGDPVNFSDPFGLCPVGCPPGVQMQAAAVATGVAIFSESSAGETVAATAGVALGLIAARGIPIPSRASSTQAAGVPAAASADATAVRQVPNDGTHEMATLGEWFRRLILAGGIAGGKGLPDRAKGGKNAPEIQLPTKPPRPPKVPDDDKKDEGKKP